MEYMDCLDFRLEFDLDRDIRILQITDMQPVDPSQQRYDGRLSYFPFGAEFTDKMKYESEFYYLEKAFKDNKPDLILVTGDIVYGEFDDNGRNLIEFVDFMESYKIPWAPVFGNHDNESKKGVSWQCAMFDEAEHCLFKRRELTGNGNYNIGIFNRGKLIRVIYMMDSNGTWHGKEYGYLKDYPPYNLDEKIEKHGGIFPDQMDYIENTSKLIDKEAGIKVKKSLCCHIGPEFANKFAYEKGYHTNPDNGNKELFSLGGDHLEGNEDFGVKGEELGGFGSDRLYGIMKDNGFDTMFVGHYHNNSLSMDCGGIRLSYGIKSSTYDYHTKIGSLLFTISDDGKYKIEHKFIDEI